MTASLGKEPHLKRLRPHLAGLVALVAWASIATGAVAIDQTINVGNNKTLSPNSGSAAINLGETITWKWVGPDTGHIIESAAGQTEQWDSDPGLTDVTVNHAINSTFPHTFTHVGAFNYHCRIHPDKMFGTITVSDAGRPTAAFTMTPPSAITGQRVDFDGLGSNDPDGIIMAWDWDLDGDGTFETSGGTPDHTYASPGTVTVQLRVTDNSNKTHTATQALVISAAPAPPPMTPSPLTPPVADTSPAVARLTVTGATKQRGADAGGVAVEVTCDPGCIVTATGSIALPGGKKIVLTKSSKTLAAASPLKLVLVVPKKSRAALKALFKTGKTATATITMTTANGLSFKKTIKLTR